MHPTKVRNSYTSVIPKVGVHLGVIGLHPLHFPPFVKMCFTPSHWSHGPLHCTFSRKPNVKVATKGLREHTRTLLSIDNQGSI
jgi:hypothetical protein